MNPGGDFGKRELSPALRSRFTEIWVPAVTRRADVGAVALGALLRGGGAAGAAAEAEAEAEAVVEGVLDFFEWFNAANAPEQGRREEHGGLALSLRDVVTWARFIRAASALGGGGLPLWEAFAHGAALVALDGLGLGTGLTPEALEDLRRQAFAKLLSIVPREAGPARIAASVEAPEPVLRELGAPAGRAEGAPPAGGEGTFGLAPFFVARGPLEPPADVGFSLLAPTTASNLRRVLRALQLPRPVLLEGSPGVGKSSLVEALAKMAGMPLVRIQLSEQTDIADLMGADMPVAAEDAAEGGAPFAWRDGSFLRAVKRGAWVLLDELNLASQSVLEGLNAVLDHRGEVFIPELSLRFACPPTFRVFAAQNPLAQGGGRRGLPRSFLNRFTKVHVLPLRVEDMGAIARQRFPAIAPPLLDGLVAFTADLAALAGAPGSSVGQLGAPWEFNLRDLFRWCEVLQSCAGGQARGLAAGAHALFLQRFRCDADRAAVRALLEARGLAAGLDEAPTPRRLAAGAFLSCGDALVAAAPGARPPPAPPRPPGRPTRSAPAGSCRPASAARRPRPRSPWSGPGRCCSSGPPAAARRPSSSTSRRAPAPRCASSR